MKIVFQTQDGKIFESRNDAAEHEDKFNQIEKPKLQVWVLDMPGTPYDKVEVVKKSEYDKLKKAKQ